jgi:hypothetical protein
LVDRGRLETGAVTSSGSSSEFAGFRFPPEVISVAARWYLRYGLSYRDAGELLAERAVTVHLVTPLIALVCGTYGATHSYAKMQCPLFGI